ncbi:MAG: hypothetical protein ACFFDI_13955, partial [Promethearchaeota archaeon]
LFLLGGLVFSYLNLSYVGFPIQQMVGLLTPYNIVLQIDLVGFFTLGLGYIFFSKQNAQNLGTRNFQIGGLCILGWLVPRIFWQFFLYQPGTDPYRTILQYDYPLATLFVMISAIILVVGTIMIGSAQKGAGGLFIMIFGVLNLVASVLLFLSYLLSLEAAMYNLFTLAISTKVYVVPGIAIVTFRLLILELPKQKEDL